MGELRLEPLAEHIGAIIHGVDLCHLTDTDIDAIQQALADHLVVFFRDQTLEPETIYELATKFGVPTPYPFVEGIEGLPEVVEIIKRPEDTLNFGGVWHSDTAYLEQPAMGALLYGCVIPESGGDTLFANMYAVLESLSPGMQSFLSGLRAINDADNDAISQTRPGSAKKGLTATHPVIRTHPVTGRPLLYINRAHTTHFEGWTRAESAPILEFLCDQIEDPQFACRFQWQPGSVAFWDNRACQHFPLNDYQGQLRKMLRISLAGDQPI